MARLQLWILSSEWDGGAHSGPAPRAEVELELSDERSSEVGGEFGSNDFSLVARSDSTSRLICGSVVGPNGGVVSGLVFEVECDDAAAPHARWTNLDSERRWDRRWTEANSAGRLGIGPRVLDVLPLAQNGEGAPRFPPLLYCREMHALLPVLCVQCTMQLSVCRDDAFLSKMGLPKYSESAERFLWCRSCTELGVSPIRIYTLSPECSESEFGAVQVRGTPNLLDDLGALVQRGVEKLSCVGCDFVTECFPSTGVAGVVSSRVTPLSLCDFAAIPYEKFDMTYKEFAAWIGEASDGLRSEPARQFLFESDRTGRLPLEILRLKLVLFRQVVELVARLHCETKRPHLALTSENVAIKRLQLASIVPAFYGFSAKLIGFGASERARFGGVDFDLFRSCLEDDATLIAADQGVSVHLDTIDRIDANTCQLSVRLVGPELMALRLKDNDILSVYVRQVRPISLVFEVHGRFVASAGEEIVVRVERAELAEHVVEQLRKVPGPLRGTVRVTRCRHVIDDLRALGYLWFETLVSNGRQSGAAVRRVIGTLEQQLADRESAADVEQVVRAALVELQGNGPLAQSNLFQNPGDWGDVTEFVPETFWLASLELGLRAVVQSPDFGICRSDDDFDRHRPEGPVERLLSEITILAQRIDTELLDLTTVRTIFAKALRQAHARLDMGSGS